MFAGFDTAYYPGDAVMKALKPRFAWCGFYLSAPVHGETSWMKTRSKLVDMGYGLAPIYLGQQLTGAGANRAKVNPAQGAKDGADAANKMKSAGFPSRPKAVTVCFLDIENGLPFPPDQSNYTKAWCDALREGGYHPGVYCSFQMAPYVAKLVPDAKIWDYHVPSVTPVDDNSSVFPTPDPKTSGYKGASVWQLADEHRIIVPGMARRLSVDLNSADSADPSAVT